MCGGGRKNKTLIDNIKNLIKIPEAIEESLKSENNIQLVAKEFLNAKGSMFLGRGSSFPIALEGALKGTLQEPKRNSNTGILKEI